MIMSHQFPTASQLSLAAVEAAAHVAASAPARADVPMGGVVPTVTGTVLPTFTQEQARQFLDYFQTDNEQRKLWHERMRSEHVERAAAHRALLHTKHTGLLKSLMARLGGKIDFHAHAASVHRDELHSAAGRHRRDIEGHQLRTLDAGFGDMGDQVEKVTNTLKNYGLMFALLQIFGVPSFTSLFLGKKKKKKLTGDDLPDKGAGLDAAQLDQLLQKLNKLHIELHKENHKNRELLKRVEELETNNEQHARRRRSRRPKKN